MRAAHRNDHAALPYRDGTHPMPDNGSLDWPALSRGVGQFFQLNESHFFIRVVVERKQVSGFWIRRGFGARGAQKDGDAAGFRTGDTRSGRGNVERLMCKGDVFESTHRYGLTSTHRRNNRD